MAGQTIAKQQKRCLLPWRVGCRPTRVATRRVGKVSVTYPKMGGYSIEKVQRSFQHQRHVIIQLNHNTSTIDGDLMD